MSEWENEFPWVYPSEDRKGMYCRLCTRFNTRNKQNGSAVFNSTPCISLRKDVLVRHADSYMHKLAQELECDRLAAESSGGIIQAFSTAASAERKAVVGAMEVPVLVSKK